MLWDAAACECLVLAGHETAEYPLSPAGFDQQNARAGSTFSNIPKTRFVQKGTKWIYGSAAENGTSFVKRNGGRRATFYVLSPRVARAVLGLHGASVSIVWGD
jgi:hypothetical protein